MRYVDLGNTVPKNKNNFTSKPKKRKSRNYLLIGAFLIFGIGSVLLFGDKAIALFNPISIVSSVAAADLDESDGRTNVLILGSDKRSTGQVNSELTDTILIASVGRVEKNVVLISLPRDLWVKTPSGYHSKINAVYATSRGGEMMDVVGDVLGIPIHYYVVVDFKFFRETIDILGGIEVDVEKAFDDFYFPVEGKENAPVEERYETVHFEAGLQTMDGDTALKYVRSRKGTNNEGTDFARAARQQKVIMAIKDKALSFSTLIDVRKLKDLYDSYSENVDTNIEFSSAQGFFILSQQIDFNSFRTIVLDDRSAADEGGLLYVPTDRSLYGGAYVLIPRVGDFTQLHAYVQRYIFGE